MLVVYDTFSGKTKKFINKLPSEFERCHISEYDGVTPFILVTFTFNFGAVPDTTKKFLSNYHEKMLGVSSAGNKVWGNNYGKAADIISNQYKVPFISKFELDGTNEDIEIFVRKVKDIVKMDSTQLRS